MTSAQPSAVLAARYSRALDIAVVIVVAGWHIAGSGGNLLARHGDYSSLAVQAVAWSGLALVIAGGAYLLLRGSSDRRAAWALASVALAVSMIVALSCPPSRMLQDNWAWGTASWIGVLVLLRRHLAELCVFLSLEALATFAVLVHDTLHRHDLAGFIVTLYASVTIQLAVAIASRALSIPARQAAAAAAREGAARARLVIASRLHAARYARWMAIHETVEPLLIGLAAGSADPANPGVRRNSAVEAARLRRLFAEGDDSPNPLVHELHACADIAERGGAAVDIETAGAVPAVPSEIRRAITDIAIAVLTTVSSRARITVTAADEGIVVSLVADSPADPPSLHHDRVMLEHQRDGENLWVEVRWNGQ